MRLSSAASAEPVPALRLFFFNDTATTQIYTLSLHDALPISAPHPLRDEQARRVDGQHRDAVVVGKPPQHLDVLADRVGRDHDLEAVVAELGRDLERDRKSTRLNSSHVEISYAVFCLKKKKTR